MVSRQISKEYCKPHHATQQSSTGSLDIDRNKGPLVDQQLQLSVIQYPVSDRNDTHIFSDWQLDRQLHVCQIICSIVIFLYFCDWQLVYVCQTIVLL